MLRDQFENMTTYEHLLWEIGERYYSEDFIKRTINYAVEEGMITSEERDALLKKINDQKKSSAEHELDHIAYNYFIEYYDGGEEEAKELFVEWNTTARKYFKENILTQEEIDAVWNRRKKQWEKATYLDELDWQEREDLYD